MITNLNYKVYKMKKKIVSPHYPPSTDLPSLIAKTHFSITSKMSLCTHQHTISTGFKPMG